MTWRRLLAMVGGAACALLAWSVMAGLLLWRSPGYVDDPTLGRIYRPGIYVNGTEGFSWSRINSLGMRSPEISAKVAGEKRILFLGDSFTEAFQVPVRKTFALRTAAALSARGTRVNAVNAGRSGASPANYIALAPWYTARVRPDVVVVQVSGQDFRKDVENPDRNFYLRRSGGSFKTVFNSDFQSSNALLQRLPVLEPVLEVPVARLASENVWKVVSGQRPQQRFLGLGGAKREAKSAVESPDASKVDTALVDWTIAELAKEYPHVIVLYLPHTDFMTGSGWPGPIRDALAAACARNGVPFVDAMGPFEVSFERGRVAPTGFANSTPGKGHLNSVGHAIVASELAPVVAEAMRR